MKTNAMNKAVLRGVRRGMKIQSGDLTGLRKRRREIIETDYVAEAWSDVGMSLRQAMTDLDRTIPPSSRPTRSSR